MNADNARRGRFTDIDKAATTSEWAMRKMGQRNVGPGDYRCVSDNLGTTRGFGSIARRQETIEVALRNLE
jgi:hypothetical protein